MRCTSSYVTPRLKMELHIHEWSGKVLPHVLGATKRVFSTIYSILESVISSKYSGTQILARDSHSNRLTSADTEYNLSVYSISTSNFKPSPLTRSIRQIPQQMLRPRNPPNQDTQIPRYRSKFNRNLYLNLYSRETEESECLDLVEFRGVAFSVENVICRKTCLYGAAQLYL